MRVIKRPPPPPPLDLELIMKFVGSFVFSFRSFVSSKTFEKTDRVDAINLIQKPSKSKQSSQLFSLLKIFT